MNFEKYLAELTTEPRVQLAAQYAQLRESLPDEAEAYAPLFSDVDTLALVRAGITKLCLDSRAKVGEVFPSYDQGRLDAEGIRFGVHWRLQSGDPVPQILMKYRDESGEAHAYEMGKAHLSVWYGTGKLSLNQLAVIEQCADDKQYTETT